MRRKAKVRRAPPPSQVCTSCDLNAVMVAGTRPRICVECFCWPPDPNRPKPKPKKEKRRKR